MGALNTQVGSSVYSRPWTDWEIQPVEFIIANDIPYCEGNVIKYVCRHGSKNGKEDLLKAIHYIQFIIESQYAEDRQPQGQAPTATEEPHSQGLDLYSSSTYCDRPENQGS